MTVKIVESNVFGWTSKIKKLIGRVCDQPVFDPRFFDDRSKDGKFKKQSKNKNFVPKNILTIQYLIYAYDVSYPTFKRWRSEGFVDTKYVHAHTGKSVMTDPDYAKQIYTARRMYVTSGCNGHMERQTAKNLRQN
jgi:hypothetical protein